MFANQTNGRLARQFYSAPLSAIADDINRALSDWTPETPEQTLTGVYPVDVREDANHILVDAELPGFKPAEVQVTIEDGVLSIVAERKSQEPAAPTGPEGQGRPAPVSHLRERRFTRVARTFKLPNLVDDSKVEAKLEDGVLRLKLQKREEVKPRRIEVK
ncbi:MAG: Hsp20/alpha crystallin family protein [Planctomycetota bacterium]|nr:Hsp20/alpha crystallin family protein [Planctomycetota bacterium]